MCATECRQPEGAFPGKSKASSVNLGEILHLVHSSLVRTLNQSISPRLFFFFFISLLDYRRLLDVFK